MKGKNKRRKVLIVTTSDLVQIICIGFVIVVHMFIFLKIVIIK